MSYFEDIQEIHSPKTVTYSSDMTPPKARKGGVAWTESPREMKASLVPRRANLMELYASSLPSAPPRNILVEQLEYSSDADGSDRLSTILEVASG